MLIAMCKTNECLCLGKKVTLGKRKCLTLPTRWPPPPYPSHTGIYILSDYRGLEWRSATRKTPIENLQIFAFTYPTNNLKKLIILPL